MASVILTTDQLNQLMSPLEPPDKNDIVLQMRRIFCCQGAEFTRRELQLGWEEINRLRAQILDLKHALKVCETAATNALKTSNPEEYRVALTTIKLTAENKGEHESSQD